MVANDDDAMRIVTLRGEPRLRPIRQGLNLYFAIGGNIYYVRTDRSHYRWGIVSKTLAIACAASLGRMSESKGSPRPGVPSPRRKLEFVA